MRQLSASVLALALGLAAAMALISCGGGNDADLLPGETASEINASLDMVRDLADSGDCEGAQDAAQQVSDQIDGLSGIDGKLKQALLDAAERLNEVVASCVDTTTEAISPPTIPEPAESTDGAARGEGKGEGEEAQEDQDRNAAGDPNGNDADHSDHARAGSRAAYGWRRHRGARRGQPWRRGGRGRVMANSSLSGRYEIGERLGSGGMSNVYQATDRILERTVAVKILAEHLSDDERFVARFRREALAVAKLIHPNIVQVYDTGVDEGRHYIVMEYVEGRSGAQILQRHGPLDADTTAEIGAQACAGLDYAHRRGIIHRDVKPGNLMIVGGPVGGGPLTVKLTDFGIARAIEQTRITQVGSVVGTAAYLAPEQVRGEEATPATDVYALGVVLYQFLTGRLPHEGSTLAELAVRQQNEKPLPPSTYNDEVPETLGAAVLRALEGDPGTALRQRRRAGGRAAARPAGRGRDAAAWRGHGADPGAGRRDRDATPRPHRADRVPPGEAAAAGAAGASAGGRADGAEEAAGRSRASSVSCWRSSRWC